MFDFSSTVDLPLIWSLIVAGALFIYVSLDGLDLGVGILFPFAPNDASRNCMINSIAPFWDGNETWLLFGSLGLFAAFPMAYSALLPALYMPIILMLFGIILRGIAFEFRFKAEGNQVHFWSNIFHYGSLCAGFFQGVILGAFLEGFHMDGRSYAGGPLDWATGFSIMTGIAALFGYALLGSTWLVIKAEGQTQEWARRIAKHVVWFVGLFMVLVSLSLLIMNSRVRLLWLSTPDIYYLGLIPLSAIGLFSLLWNDLYRTMHEHRPFLMSIGLLASGYIGLGISVFPWIIPYHYTIYEAASSGPSQSLLLIGVAPFILVVLSYTAYCYYLFRGKASNDSEY
jgi:cytochrome bd ubiquinol oxidase subunit II